MTRQRINQIIFQIVALGLIILAHGKPQSSTTTTTPKTTSNSSSSSIPRTEIVNINSNNGKVSTYFDVTKKCSFANNGSDEELSKCITKLRDEIRPRMGDGVAEIGFKPLEPIHLKTFYFHEGTPTSPIQLHCKFRDLNMWGLTSYTKWTISIDKKAKTWSYDMLVPKMKLEGNYELTGKVFVFELGGNGTFYFNLRDFSLSGTNPLIVKTNDAGQQYIVASRAPINMDIQHIHIHLNNLFNGNQILGPVINNFLNDNIQEIFEEIKPGLMDQVADIGAYVINGLLGGVAPLAKYIDPMANSAPTNTTTTTR